MSSSTPTRTRILEAALAFMEGSPQKASTGRIAELAGVSRQAVYLHFANKAQLMIAAAQHADVHYGLEQRLAPVRAADTAKALLGAHARFLAEYNPLIYPVVRAVDAIRKGHPDLEASWRDRLANRRSGCREIAGRLAEWSCLARGWSVPAAGDWITGQSSVKLWEELVLDLGWSRQRYTGSMARALTDVLVSGAS